MQVLFRHYPKEMASVLTTKVSLRMWGSFIITIQNTNILRGLLSLSRGMFTLFPEIVQPLAAIGQTRKVLQFKPLLNYL